MYHRLLFGRSVENRRSKQSIGILGSGYSVPPLIRRNEDPIFRQITTDVNAQGVAEKDLFTGLKERRCLADGERIESYMVEAAQWALLQSHVVPEQIDRLYGYTSVSSYVTPNSLYAIHRELKLSERTLVVPINSEFSNFLLSLIQAWEAIEAGHSTYALIVCGTNWTRYMDYTQGHSLSVGDGAGAVLVGPGEEFTLVDYATRTLSNQYGAMTMQMRAKSTHGQRYVLVDENNVPIPTYEITQEEGISSFQVSAMHELPRMINELLKKHRLTGRNIGLITHQASRVLMDHWADAIQPKEYLDTLEQFGNMTMATYPTNFAYFAPRMTSEYLVFAALGVGYHQTAVLLKRA
jgi:3-oxoacyl-[acyl-carrier-protein] synthase-3